MKNVTEIARRTAVLLLALVLCIAMCACSKGEAKKPKESDDPPSNVETSNPDDNDVATPDTPSPSPEPTPIYESIMIGTVKEINTFLNVRSGPGTDYEVVGKAYTGDTFKVVLKFVDGGYWHKVEYGSTFAYVHSDYLDITTELVEVVD